MNRVYIMNITLIQSVAAALLVFFACSRPTDEARNAFIMRTPAVDEYAVRNPDGITVLPNGRLIRPAGKIIETAPYSFGLAVSPDENDALTVNSTYSPDAYTLLRHIHSNKPAVLRPPDGHAGNGLRNAFMGAVYAPDGIRIYVSGGDSGIVALVDARSGRVVESISVNTWFAGRRYRDSFVGELALSPDGSILYAVDQANFRLIAIDTETLEIVDSIPAGRYPFGLAVAPDGKKVYVANAGMFEYSMIPGFDADRAAETGITFPAFGFNTEEMRRGAIVEGKRVPGLGDPNDAAANSVWSFDVSRRGMGRVTATIRTGYRVGENVDGIEAVGGASPNSLVTDGEFLYVSNGTNDNIAVIDAASDTIITHIPFIPDTRLGSLRGAIPFGLALSSDGSRLYAALAGINAVGVIDTRSRTVLGYIPTCWYPSKITVSKDDKTLYVVCAKGFGTGPNAGPDFRDPAGSTYLGRLMFGTVAIIDIENENHLAGWSETVLDNNFAFEDAPREASTDAGKQNPVPPVQGLYESPIRHVVYITKENRTFDEVYGALEGVRGLPGLARFGSIVQVSNRDGSRAADSVLVMPNHLKLAREFTISDNFYCDSDVSADGHRWLVGTYTNEWVETAKAASYGGGRRYILESSAPGRRGVTGSSGAIYPEDYNEAGSIWEHFIRNGIEFFNFGLGFEFVASANELSQYTGVLIAVNYPLPEPLMERTSRTFATYNTNIPDQFRVDNFIEEFRKRWIDGGEELPPILTMMLPNDHGAGERPDEGYPFFESYMADNDLALGRVVEFLSRTEYWKHMAIFVTEDDAQSGVDHVDAHRSLLMVISPYARKGHISSVHASFASIIKTIELIHNIPFLNQYDAGANPLEDCFTANVDVTAYDAAQVDGRIFDPAKALDPLDEGFNWQNIGDFPVLDDPVLMERWAREQKAK